jgi:hypothetical protein
MSSQTGGLEGERSNNRCCLETLQKFKNGVGIYWHLVDKIGKLESVDRHFSWCAVELSNFETGTGPKTLWIKLWKSEEFKLELDLVEINPFRRITSRKFGKRDLHIALLTFLLDSVIDEPSLTTGSLEGKSFLFGLRD